MSIKTILNTSIFKTILFNVKYFGLKSIFNPYVIVSKNTILKELKGHVYKENTGRILLGYGNTGIKTKFEKTVWENAGDIYFGGTASIGYGSKLINKGQLFIGNNFKINTSSNIICYKKVSIGQDCLFSWDVTIMDTDFHKIYENEKNINEDAEIIIGNKCWLGYGVNVKKGTIIPNNCVVASNSVITKKLCVENCVYVNNQIAKQNIRWEL